jgi:hypothetical protein
VAGTHPAAAIDEVAFNAGHPRFWGEAALAESSLLRSVKASGDDVELAEIARLYRELQSERRSEPGQASGVPTERSGDLLAQALAALLAPVDEALAGLTYLPLGMLPIVGDADAAGPAEDELGSDGLAAFSSSLFLDPVLAPNPAIQPVLWQRAGGRRLQSLLRPEPAAARPAQPALSARGGHDRRARCGAPGLER